MKQMGFACMIYAVNEEMKCFSTSKHHSGHYCGHTSCALPLTGTAPWLHAVQQSTYHCFFLSAPLRVTAQRANVGQHTAHGNYWPRSDLKSRSPFLSLGTWCLSIPLKKQAAGKKNHKMQ